MKLKNKTVFITGASGGIGASLIDALVKYGVSKIYGADLSIEKMSLLSKKYPDVVIPVVLDVTKQNDVIACSERYADIDILINNAGVEFATGFLSEHAFKAGPLEMAVNYFGVHYLSNAFWEILKNKKEAAIVNVLSIASFTLIAKLGTYCASKAAAHFLTLGLRHEAKESNIKVFGVYPGYVDTAMTKNIEVEKVTPIHIAEKICIGIESDTFEIFPDKMSEELSKKCYSKNNIFSDFDK